MLVKGQGFITECLFGRLLHCSLMECKPRLSVKYPLEYLTESWPGCFQETKLNYFILSIYSVNKSDFYSCIDYLASECPLSFIIYTSLWG